LALETASEIHKNPVYDVNKSFWKNFETGPRSLTEKELKRIQSLQSQINNLQKLYDIDLSTELFDKKVASPIALASGPAPNSKWIKFYSKLGYDILTTKTVRDRYWSGYELPNILQVEGNFEDGFVVSDEFRGSITNSFGIGSLDIKKWSKDYKSLVEELPKEKALIISVTATPTKNSDRHEIARQYAKLSKLVKRVGSNAVELNFSCPNVTTKEGNIYSDPKLSSDIVDSVLDEVGPRYPILVKVGYLPSYKNFVEKLVDKIYGIVAVNAMPARVSYKNGSSAFPERGNRSGICGMALKNLGLNAVKQLNKLRESFDDFKIFGVGGILDVETALEYLKFSDVIEMGTAAIYKPTLALEIKKKILEREVKYE
jgi:dihydroorotate dehydrogenase